MSDCSALNGCVCMPSASVSLHLGFYFTRSEASFVVWQIGFGKFFCLLVAAEPGEFLLLLHEKHCCSIILVICLMLDWLKFPRLIDPLGIPSQLDPSDGVFRVVST